MMTSSDDETPLHFTQLERRRGNLVDSVQVARCNYDRVRDDYAKGKATLDELDGARGAVNDAESLLAAHDEIHPPPRGSRR